MDFSVDRIRTKNCEEREPKTFKNLPIPPPAFSGNYSLAVFILWLKTKQNHELERAESGKSESSVLVEKTQHSFDFSLKAIILSDFPNSL